MENDPTITQLVDEFGVFNAHGLDEFVSKNAKLANRGVDYAVVSIMGPQSSGKSTLLNHLFHTNFTEMNAELGRNQTTKGIWLAECVGIEPFTMVMDLEGNDERGQDTTFEKQAALFAHCSDIGRENAANKPLLRTLFEVMLQTLDLGRQITLMFIIRDLEQTPLELLRKDLSYDIHKIWNGVQKPEQHRNTKFSDAFKMEVVGLPHYVFQLDKFKEEVAHLRERFRNSIYPGGLAGCVSRENAVPILEFSFSSQLMWKLIKENRNLNLPDHKVMVSNVRCEAIANKKLEQLRQNEDWLVLKRDVEISPVQESSKRLSSIIDAFLSEYDKEVQYFDKKVRKTKRKEVLERKALDEVYPAYEMMLGHLRHREFKTFKARMTKSNTRKKDELFQAVYTHTEAVVSAFDKASKGSLTYTQKLTPMQ